VRLAERHTTEFVAADLAHDRGIGGFIGPVVFGVAGGYSNSSSSARRPWRWAASSSERS